MAETILECKSLTISVGYKTIFRDLSFSFPETGMVLIQGENGAGKSTLLKEIYHRSSSHPAWVWPKGKKSLSYLGHDLGLYSSLTLTENLDYFLSLGKRTLPQDELDFWLSRFGLEKRRREPLHTFSRGMKQKAALIRSFLVSPNIVLLDEPYTGLDVASIRLLTDILNEEKSKRLIIIVLHEIPEKLEILSKIQLGKTIEYVS
ncbi:ABC transporter ATP-binding protein [Leptospira idonii]|uniref:ABC transporter ATP-binding protein n=1 Tax=Leptospira idonii TaxID=1193500 RepID=A0A4R9LXI3_9LEPT|nr:ATP-binding cassette domain-containing protein [Leptospira idonii]TGN18382.1 ABC transporter ATP-binding protein [Leptospira idonii]